MSAEGVVGAVRRVHATGRAHAGATGSSAAPRREHRSARTLQDRDDEIAAMDAAVDRAVDGSGSLVVFTGPIGSGRTALLDECARRGTGRGLRVLRARGNDGLGAALAVADRLLGAGPVRPRAAAPGDGDGFASRHATLAGVTADAPALLLLDDVTRCDVPSARWLSSVARRLPGLRLSMVLTALDGDTGTGDDDRAAAAVAELVDRADTVRRLRPLTFEGISVVARTRIGDRADPSVLGALTEVSGGNPLFLDAVVDEIAAGPEGQLEQRVRECSPSRLRDRMASAVRHAPAPVRAYLAAVAAVGDVADDGMLGRLSGLDPSDTATAHRAARRSGLVGPGEQPHLRHRSVGDALDAARSAAERRDTHLRAASLLRDYGVPSDRIAVHLLALTGSTPEWTVDVLREAARSAGRRGEPMEAVHYLRHALLAEPADADRARVLVELATLERRLDPGLALRRIVQAVPLLDSATARADALCRVTPLALDGAAPSVVALVRAVAEELGPEPDTELALRLEARLRYVETSTRAGLDAAAGRLGELERRPQGLTLDTPGERELVSVLLHAAAVAGRRGAARVAEVARAALAREPASPDHVHSTVGTLISCLCMADAVDELPAWLAVAADHACAERAGVDEAVVRAELAAVLACAGRGAEARDQVGRSMELADGLVDDSLLPGLVLAPVVTAVHDPEIARRILARYGSVPSVPPGFGACLQMLRARGALDAGEPVSALEYCLDAGRRFERAGWVGTVVPWRLWAVEILRSRGRLTEARAMAERELAHARAWGAPTSLGRALRTLGELGGPDRDRAGELLAEAVAVLTGAGDRCERERASRALAEHRGSTAVPAPQEVAPPGPPSAGGSSAVLTRSERRVATRAAAGRTNQQIASDLEVSVRAVEKHLTAVYRKLGVSGRSALCRMWEAEPHQPA
ncbi:LuxR C-terminal-related transcriptional regulator [Pseudonocardia endophytica]|uniref:AAA ATPase-like protein n=1 Tax=Pseudonocardia endophytica TaxID=401976 RepID=A0A4R1HQT0_PSEEN|nr:helix-turn-helix transcriptional regulator [Pseudonocardia endophytica]TCK24488.1 AAA ATPase-like protein [Pseudonocardia endophytica]